MEAESILQLLFLILLLVLSAFFSSAETALTTVSEVRIKTMAQEGNKKAETVIKIISDSPKMLSAILIGNNIVNLSASSLATTLAVKILGNYGAGIATGVLTFLILIFGEITPKTMAKLKAEEMSLKYGVVIWRLMWLLTPIIYVVNFLAGGLMRAMGISKEDVNSGLTATEIKNIVETSHESGTLEVDERNLIYQYIDFQDSNAKEIMIPRIDMTTISESWSYERIMEEYEIDKFTRMPVVGADKEEIVGILNMKSLLSYRQGTPFHITEYMQDAFFTYEMKKTSELFEQMRRGHISLAIVLDEYGSV
ncbi:MAG: hemolysin family protein, partial [Lachnospiraceae bacterium]|nr:hemolysin family protein [Lachnospiraceae bacterium]